MDIIERLKKNEKPFGLMDEDLQDFTREIEKNNFKYYHYSAGGFCDFDNKNIGNVFLYNIVYQLKADYQPEPEIVECKVIIADNKNFDNEIVYIQPDGQYILLPLCTTDPSWYGFKWSDETIMRADVNCRFRKWLNGKLEWPTHVLMKEVV